MKGIILICTILSLTLINTTNVNAQEASQNQDKFITASITVSGNCGHCKARIEDAAKAAKANKAVWDAETQKLTVSFDPNVTSIAKIEQKLADAGHDTDSAKASNRKYKSLPECCKYDRKGIEK